MVITIKFSTLIKGINNGLGTTAIGNGIYLTNDECKEILSAFLKNFVESKSHALVRLKQNEKNSEPAGTFSIDHETYQFDQNFSEKTKLKCSDEIRIEIDQELHLYAANDQKTARSDNAQKRYGIKIIDKTQPVGEGASAVGYRQAELIHFYTTVESTGTYGPLTIKTLTIEPAKENKEHVSSSKSSTFAKFFRAEQLDEAKAEAVMTKKLSKNPGKVRLSVNAKCPVIFMEYMPGAPLNHKDVKVDTDRLSNDPLSPLTIAHIICSDLDDIHTNKGYVHADVKSENINASLEQKTASFLDFGHSFEKDSPPYGSPRINGIRLSI